MGESISQLRMTCIPALHPPERHHTHTSEVRFVIDYSHTFINCSVGSVRELQFSRVGLNKGCRDYPDIRSTLIASERESHFDLQSAAQISDLRILRRIIPIDHVDIRRNTIQMSPMRIDGPKSEKRLTKVIPWWLKTRKAILTLFWSLYVIHDVSFFSLYLLMFLRLVFSLQSWRLLMSSLSHCCRMIPRMTRHSS